MELTIVGRIQPTDPDAQALGGCRVEAFFDLEAPAESGERTRLLADPQAVVSRALGTIQSHASARTSATGQFKLTIPDDPKRAGTTVRFVVSGPAGQTIGKLSRDLEASTDALVITVDMNDAAPIALEAPPNVPKDRTRRITGQVFDRTGRTVPANTQVMIFAKRSDDPSAAEAVAPILVARTDGSGNFFGDAPNESYKRATAVVAGIPGEISILLSNGMIPGELPFLVKVPEGIAPSPKTDCCGDRRLTPRTPSQADIINAPDTYSTDLGTGGCVQFNTPNRAIEEFDFYSVVRTTEPDIVGFTTAGDPMAGPPIGDVPLATIALATAAVAAAESAKAAAAAAVADASQKEAAAIKAEQRSTELGAILNRAIVKNAVKGALGDKLGMGWSKEIAKGLVFTALLQDGASPLDANACADLLAALIAGESVTNRTDFAVVAQEIVDSAAASLEAAATKARAEAAAATATVAKTAKVAAASAQAAAAAEAAKAAEIARRAQALDAAARNQLEAQRVHGKPPGRYELNRNNPIDWDETPTFYQAAEIAHGHLLHFKQTWYADGYSLGDLLYSLPLAPGQKKLISVVDWERRERTERIEDTFSSEGVNAAFSRDRDLGEVVTGALTESSRGGSKSTSVGVGGGAGAAGNGSYQAFNFGAVVGVSGGYGQSDAVAWQASARNLSSSSLQTLRDRTLQSASAVRALRSSVVHTVAQGETLRATTEVVANHNHCHAMTIQYFEVLRHLKLVHELADVQECLFVPLPMSRFDLAKALRWRQPLRTYLQRTELAGGFDAARRVQTNWLQSDAPLDRYADEIITSVSGELLLTVMIPMPPFPDRPKPKPADPADAATAVSNAINPTEGAWGVILGIATGGASLIAGKATEAAINISKAAAQGVHGLVDEFYSQPTPQERYDKFQAEIMPGVVEAFVDQLELWALVQSAATVLVKGADFTLVSAYQPGIPLKVSLRGTLAGQISRGDISQLIIKSSVGVPTGCKAIVNAATIRYRTTSFEHSFVDDSRVNDDIDPAKVTGSFSAAGDFTMKPLTLGTGATLFTPLDFWEQRSPRTEDMRLTADLVEHLNDNLEYYHHAIWWTMDPNRRYMLLDGFYAPGSNNRSVASVVENRLIGIVGNSAVLPVARGVHLNPRFSADRNGKRADLLDFYKLEQPVPAARVSLPTRGVFAEAVLGECNSCEEIDESKFWRWEESPIDEPPSIEPISTGTRRADPASVLPSPFPMPLVSIQNALAVPDPAGVGGTLTALGQQSFADITGLAATQANAAAAFSKAMDTALAFGKEASTLAQQAAAQKSLDKNLAAISKAQAKQQLPEEDVQRLATTAIEKAVGAPPAAPKASDIAKTLETIKKAVADDAVAAPAGKRIAESVLKSYAGDTTPGVPDERAAATRAIDSVADSGRVASVETDGTKVTSLPIGEVPGAPGPVIPHTLSEFLHLIEGGATTVEVTAILAQLSSAAPATLLALETAGELIGPVGWFASLAAAFVEVVNVLDTGLRHDETMGWAYGITWAIDSDAAAVAHSQRTPAPTGVAYDPKGVGDPPELRRQRFDEGAERGMDVILLSSITEERTEVAARLTFALSIAVRRLGTVGGHKQFVTELFRYAYRDANDQFHRETWTLDWPTMQAHPVL